MKVISCALCEEDEPISNCTMWNRSRMCCKKCKTHYNRQMERNQQSSQLKTWWAGLALADKTQWYRKQKSQNPQKWARKTFDSDNFKQSEFQERKQDTGDLDDFLPMNEWIKQHLAMSVIPDKVKAKAEAVQAWKDALLDVSISKRDHPVYGRLVHVFRGVRVFTGTSEGMRASLERNKGIEEC